MENREHFRRRLRLGWLWNRLVLIWIHVAKWICDGVKSEGYRVDGRRRHVASKAPDLCVSAKVFDCRGVQEDELHRGKGHTQRKQAE